MVYRNSTSPSKTFFFFCFLPIFPPPHPIFSPHFLLLTSKACLKLQVKKNDVLERKKSLQSVVHGQTDRKPVPHAHSDNIIIYNWIGFLRKTEEVQTGESQFLHFYSTY